MEINSLIIVFTLILIVILFEFVNGFNDFTNMAVTPVVTGAMEPKEAILIISAFEFIGAWFFGTAVAQTLGKGIVNPQDISISTSSALGFPVSTTQIVSSSILGAGSAQSTGRVRWVIGKHIFFTWIITIPGSAILSALFFVFIKSWT